MAQTESNPLLRNRDWALDWLTALSPLLLLAYVYYSWQALGLVLVSAAGCLTAAVLLQWAKVDAASAPQSLMYGALTALLLPVTAPLWVAAIGGAVAAVCSALPEYLKRWLPASRLLWHPALMGWLVVRWCFASVTDGFVLPVQWQALGGAQPLSNLTPLVAPEKYDVLRLLFGVRESAIAEGCAPVLALASLYLLLRRRWRLIAPATMLATVALLSHAVWGLPLHGILVGGTVVAALILGDATCAVTTKGGQVLLGLMAGGVTVLVRATLGVDGAAVGVLLAGLLSPLFAPALRLCGRLLGRLWGCLCRGWESIYPRLCEKFAKTEK